MMLMPEKGYFRRMGIYAATGLIALIITVLVVGALAVLVAPVAALIASAFAFSIAAIAMFALLFLFVFGLVYLVIMVGVFVEYVRKPMKVKPGSYSSVAVSEAGVRSKGPSKGRTKAKKKKA